MKISYLKKLNVIVKFIIFYNYKKDKYIMEYKISLTRIKQRTKNGKFIISNNIINFIKNKKITFIQNKFIFLTFFIEKKNWLNYLQFI